MKEKILLAAISLWSKDINTSLGDIANHLDISRRTVHRHYQTKELLVAQVMQYLLNNYIKSIDEQLHKVNEPLNKLKKLFYNDVKQNENYLLFTQLRSLELENAKVDKQKVREIIGIYRKIFAQLISQNIVNDLISVSWLESLYSAIIEATIKSIQNGGLVEDTIFIAWQTFCHGIKA